MTTQQPAPANPGTQVVVNPGTTTAAPPPSSSTHVSVSDDTTTGVTTTRPGRSAGVIVATDALYGGLAGLAIGGGVALLSNDGNWGRDLAIGAGAGLLIGGIFGAVDAVASADRMRPAGEVRDIGMSRAVSPIGGKF